MHAQILLARELDLKIYSIMFLNFQAELQTLPLVPAHQRESTSLNPGEQHVVQMIICRHRSCSMSKFSSSWHVLLDCTGTAHHFTDEAKGNGCGIS